jgi:hypothetical protein
MKNKIFKYIFIAGGIAALIGGGVFSYMFFMPHRDVQASSADFNLTTSDLVKEYLTSYSEANNKYLQEEGESKILSVQGKVKNISKNLNGNMVILLQDDSVLAGVRCTFMPNTNTHVADIKKGDLVTVKGVIRAGASYDEDLELYEDVILEKCDII